MSRSQMKYHPRIGYTFMPSAKLRVPGATGGYLVRTNAAGFRSDREFVAQGSPGIFRALLFGDSQTAGDGGPNSERYSDLLEKAVPGLEIFNYGLSGTGTDQQFLAYQECADVEHDLLVIGLYVENIRRVSRRIVKSRETNGVYAYYAKPYYLIEHDELVLRNVPVPKQAWTEQTLPAALHPHVYSYLETNLFARNKRPALHKVASMVPVPLRKSIKRVVTRLSKFQPLPEYDAPDKPEWLLLRRLLETWLRASRTPVLLVTIPHYLYSMASSDPTGYQARCRDLAEHAGCHLYDFLPDIWKLSAKERSTLWCASAQQHLSSNGHAILASLLAPIFERFVKIGRVENRIRIL
ncbi:MAG: hypothetical protein ACRERU_10010 [Methylococcales bacterium]